MDVHVAERKLNSPLPNIVLWQRVTARPHSLPLLCRFHLFVKNEQYQFFPFPFRSDCHSGCAPHVTSPWSQTLTFFIQASLLSFGNCFQKTLSHPPPPPSLDNRRHSEYRVLSIDSTYLTMTFSNLKSGTGCQFDESRLIDSSQPWESTSMSLTLKSPPGHPGFYLGLIVATPLYNETFTL